MKNGGLPGLYNAPDYNSKRKKALGDILVPLFYHWFGIIHLIFPNYLKFSHDFHDCTEILATLC